MEYLEIKLIKIKQVIGLIFISVFLFVLSIGYAWSASTDDIQAEWIKGLLIGQDMSELSTDYATMKPADDLVPYALSNPIIQYQQAEKLLLRDLNKLVQLKGAFEPKHQKYLNEKVKALELKYQHLNNWLLNIQANSKKPATKTADKFQNLQNIFSDRWGVIKLAMKQPVESWGSLTRNSLKYLSKESAVKSSDAQVEAAILRNDRLPYSSRNFSAPELFYTPVITPSYADDSTSAVTAEDLASGDVIQLTPEIYQLAASLDYDYIKIYNFVRQQVSEQYYAGSMKGSQGTLLAYAGNDVDQAALLIALLRASNIPAHFVQGVIELPVDQAVNGLGLSDTSQVLAALARAGIAHELVVQGGQVTRIHKKYTWVSANVPYAHYRGSANDLSEPVWIPLAPAYKTTAFAPSDFDYTTLDLDEAQLVSDYLLGSAASINASPLSYWRDQVQQQYSGDYQQLLVEVQSTTQSLSVLPASLPFEVIAATFEGADLLTEEVHKLNIQLTHSGSNITQIQLSLTKVAGRRLTLSYLPATVDDLNIINQAGGMSQVPPYLIDLRPVIKINGRQIEASSLTIPMGAMHQLNLQLESPSGSVNLERHLFAGTYVSLVLGIQDDDFPMSWEGVNSTSDETKPIRLIHNLGVNYHKSWYKAENELAKVMGHVIIRPLASMSILAPEFKLETFGGLPIRMQFSGVSLDAISRTADVVSRTGDNESDWMRLASLQGSWLESDIFRSQWALAAISADQGLRLQAAGGNLVHYITADNLSTILPTTTHPDYVKSQIEAWVNTGHHAWVPQNLTSQDTWLGSSWHIWNPETGNSGYFIAGGYAGGQTTPAPGEWSLSELSEMLTSPYAEGVNDDPLAARTIKVVEQYNKQVGTAGENLPESTQVLVTDFVGRPVKGALVTFTLSSSDHTLINGEESSNESIKVRTNEQGIAAVDLELAQQIKAYIMVLLNPEDEFESRVGRVSLQASVVSNVGDLYPEDIISHIYIPGPAERIEVIDCNVYGWDCDLFTYFGTHAGSMHARVVDQYDNYVSNVSYTVNAGPSLLLSPNKNYDSALKKVVTNTHSAEEGNDKTAEKSIGSFPYSETALVAVVDACDELPSLAPPACATSSQTLISGPAWNSFHVYAGALASYPNQIRDFPLLFNSTGLPGVQASLYARLYTPFNQFLFNNLIQTGPFGNYISAEPGSQIELRASLLEQIYQTSLGYYIEKFYPPNVSRPDRIIYEIINETLIGGATQEVIINEDGYDIRQVQMGTEFERSQFKTTLKSIDDGNTFTFQLFTYADAANIELNSIFPERISLNDDSLLLHDLNLEAVITPSQYRPLDIRFNTYKDNELISSQLFLQPGSPEFNIIFSAGYYMDPASVYEVEYIMNEGTVYEITSGKQDVSNFSVKLVGAVNGSTAVNSFSNGLNGGRVYLGKIVSPLKVFKNVDLANANVCGFDDISIDIINDSMVTIDLQPLDQAGQPTGDVINLVTDELMTAGANPLSVKAEELGTQTFDVLIYARSLVTDDEEIITGTLVSNYDISNSLPIGHAVVKGVDLADGSMVYSKKDIALIAPGSDLEFIRTYSSQSRSSLTVMGNGWTHNYLSRVIVGPCGQVTVTGADAGSARFQAQGEVFIPLKGYHSSLVANEDGSFDFFPKGGNRHHYIQLQENVWWMDFIEDPNGNRITIELQPREVSPIITSVTDSVGRKLFFDYEIRDLGLFNSEMLVSVSGPEDIKLTFDYDDIGNLIEVKREGDSTDEKLTYSGDLFGPSRSLLKSVTSQATGAVRSWQFQEKNFEIPPQMGDIPDIISIEVMLITESDAGSTGFIYTPSAGYNSAATVMQNGQLTQYQMNPYGAATEITSPAGTRTFDWETGTDVLLMVETDENNRQRTFEYDDYGNVIEERIGSLVSNYTYYTADQFNPPFIKDRIKSHSNWRGYTTEYSYDLNGNKKTEELDQVKIKYDYDDQGLLKNMTDGRGLVSLFTYDNFGYQKSIRNPAGDTNNVSFNARGQMLTQTDANGYTTNFTYDYSDRVTSKQLGERIWTYDYQNGGLIRVETDPNTHSTTYSYDTQGRLLETTNADEDTFTYVYDLNGNKTSENDFGGHETTFEYDDANRLRIKTEPAGSQGSNKVTTYDYDNVGNVLSETTTDRITEYGYDPNRYFQTTITRKSTGGDAVITRVVDGNGNVESETDPNSNETTYTYDAFDRMLTMNGPMGSGQVMTYDNNGNVETEEVFNSTGNQTTLKAYDLANRLKQVTLAEGGIITYGYDGNGNIKTESKPNGYLALYSYNDLNLPIMKTINQQTWLLDYDLAGNLKTERWPLVTDNNEGNLVTYNYDALNREISRTDTVGLIQSQTHDADSNLATMTDGNGQTTTYEYNALHQRTLEIKPLGRGHSYTYTVFDELLTDTGPNGTITHGVDQLGRRYSSTGPDDYSMTYGYDLNGNLTSQTDSRNITTTYLVNALNQTYQQTTGSFVMTMSHDTVGNVLTQTDYRGILSVSTYDKDNRQETFTRSGVLQSTTTYNNAGLPTVIKDARGNNTVHEYNSQYHKTRTLMPENQIITFTPNAFGDVELQNNPGPNDITRTYDLRRRLKTETNGAGEMTSYEYDLNNNRTAVIKPGGQRWEYDFDAANRLTAVRNVPEEIETIYGYDAADNLETITDALGRVNTFTFDNRNRKKSKTYPGANDVNGDVIVYDYDANSNLKTITYPNGVVTDYSYDDLNRQYQQDYSGTYGSASVTLTLDGNGNVEHIAETMGTNSYTYSMSYDDLDRMESKTDRYGNVFLYTYDANGNRKQFRDHDNKVTTYDYDKLNRLKQLTQAGLGAFTWTYNNAGLPKSIDYPNGSQANYDYDNANRIALIDNTQSGVTVTSHAYEYDLNGNRDKLTESNIDASQITTYEYDDADRLTKVFYPTKVASYTLDKVGNRELEVVDSGGVLNTLDYGYNNRDQLTSVTDSDGLDITYDYDAFGNQTEKDTNGVITTFDYTARQRVKSITIGTASPNEYEYDYAGQRVNSQTNGMEKRYLYDGLTLVAETNAIGNTLATYHYGQRRQLAETRNSTNSYYLADALGTNVAITNQDGSIQNRMDYDVWGNLNQETGSSESPFGFTGYIRDEDTDLYYANARYYDSFTGRFLREDPFDGDIQITPSLHRYLYAYSNPMSYIDPDGKLGIFLDGSWNNKNNPDEDIFKTRTNVSKLRDLYEGESIYIEGVGTNWYTSWVGGLTGWGVQNRVDRAYRSIARILNENKHLQKTDPEAWAELTSLDFFGFSRGSTTAIALTNKIIEEGIPDYDSQYYDFHNRKYVYKDSIGVNIRFLGVYDTVGAIGDPFDGENGLNLTVNTEKVAKTSHAIMVNEGRFAFDVIGLDDLEFPMFANINQRVFLGSHGNGGGNIGRSIDSYWYFRMDQWRVWGGGSIPYPNFSYETRWRNDQDKPNNIANLTLAWMHSEGKGAGVPFKPLTGLDGLVPDIANMTVDEIEREFVHDSRLDWKYSIERWTNRTDRTVYYPFKGDGAEKTFTYEKLKSFYEDDIDMIIQESSSESGVKAK